MTRKIVLRTSVAVIALMASAGVTSAQAASSASADSGVVTEVIVTATKRDTKLQETPVAITALSAKTLSDQHVNTIQDITHLVPSFQATSEGDHGVITLTLRGIGNDSAKTEYADPEVATFVDGVYTPRAEGATTLLFDLDSVEVDRGPQGTLWGRNSTVGAVNMITAKPKIGVFGGDLEVGGGNYDRFGTRGAINLPVNDTLAFRVSFAHEQHDGYVAYQQPVVPSLASQRAAALAAGVPAANFQAINPNLFVQGGPRYDAQDQSAVRLSGLWAPTDRLTWNFSYEYFQDRGTPDMNLMQNPRPGEAFWSALIDTAPYLHRDVHTFRSRVDYRLTDDIGLAYIAGYSRFTGASDFDQDGGTHVPTSFTSGATHQEDRTNYSRYVNYSHEVEVKSLGHHTVDWILGVYYAAEDNAIRFDIPIFNGTQQGTVGWQGSFIQPKETVDSKAVFGQAVWNLGDRIHLTGGLRYTDDHRGNQGGTNNGWTGDPTVPQVPLDPSTIPGPASGFSAYQHNDGSYHSSKLTWLARADADVTKDFLVYASVSTGYKSGGLQDGGLAYNPETVTNYEVGTKNTLFDGRVTWNNAFYYEDFHGYQFSAPVAFPDGSHGLDISNTQGSTKVYGFESELSARVTPDDQVLVSIAALHTELGVLRFAGSNDLSNLPVCANPAIGACEDVTGHSLPHAPSVAVTLLYQHDFHLGNGALLSPRISTHYETSSWLTLFHDGAGDMQKAYDRTDLGLKYSSESDGHPWAVDFYVQNVDDGRVKTGGTLVTSDNIYSSQYLPPRTYGVNLSVKF